MKFRFADIWNGPLPTEPSDLWSRPEILQGAYGYMYMSLWLAFINVVVEGWKKIGLADDTIDDLLRKGYVDNLKVFRHTVFHWQKHYWAKMAEKHLAIEGFLEWAVSLDEEFERWFKDKAPRAFGARV
jgi:hypothetical protein